MGRAVLGWVVGAGLTLACVATVGACGSRGPLDDDGPIGGYGAADAGTVDASADDAAPPPPDARADAPAEGGSILGCGTCLAGQCSQGILKCVQTPACQQTLQCAVTTCLSGGAPNVTCLLGCAAGNTTAALELVQILQCVTSTCGTDCTPLLGGLLGGAGGGGGGGAGGGGAGGGGPPGGGPPGGGPPPPPKSPPAKAVPPIAKAFYSHWPELMTPVAPAAARSPTP
jgi:hypothetical protein